jgi:outer membrane receptor for ferrienterochelin and colicins
LLFVRKTYLLLTLLAASFASLAQDAAIRVLNAETGKPIEYVHLIFTDSTTSKTFVTTTDASGYAENLATNRSNLVVSFVGFEPLKTKVDFGKSYTFKLNQGSESLTEVVVTAQYLPVAESKSVYKVNVINREHIDNRGAVTLNQVLNDQLNMRITQDNTLGSGVVVQGLGDNNLKILIDGVPVAGRLNGNIDLSQINLDNIERIEVIEGPMSVMYGSNALAGTINLITKKPKKNRIEAGAKAYVESVGLYNFDVYSNWGTPTTGTKINFGRNFFDGWNPTPTDRYQQWKQKEQYFGNAGIKHDFKNWSLGYTLDGLWEQIKDKGDRRSEFSNYAFDSWYTTNRWMNTLTSDIKNIPNHSLNLIGSYTWYSRSKVRYNRDLVNLTQEPTSNPDDHDTTVINTALFRGTLSSAHKGPVNYQIGADLNWENTFGGRIEGTPEIGDYALFGSLQWRPSERFVVQPALRWAYNTQFSAPLVPSINLQYYANENFQLRFSYANGFRAPSLKELYLEFVDANHNILGNPELQSETSFHLNFNAILNTRISMVQSLRTEASLFYNNLQNMINLTQVRGTYFTYLNVDQYTTFGGKIQVQYNIHPDFDFKLGYAHLGYTNRVYEELGGDRYLFSPEVSASFNYWRSSKKFRFNVIYKYNGAMPGFRLGDDGEAVQTRLPAYNVMDITSSYAFLSNKLTVSAGVKNLFNVQNLDVQNATGGVHSSGNFPVAWGRTFFIGLSVSL